MGISADDVAAIILLSSFGVVIVVVSLLLLLVDLSFKFDRKMLGYATLLMDVGGPCQMMLFLKSLSNLLHRYYPEQLHRCILYAIPKSALWIWDMLQLFLDTNISNLIHLINNNTIQLVHAQCYLLFFGSFGSIIIKV